MLQQNFRIIFYFDKNLSDIDFGKNFGKFVMTLSSKNVSIESYLYNVPLSTLQCTTKYIRVFSSPKLSFNDKTLKNLKTLMVSLHLFLKL